MAVLQGNQYIIIFVLQTHDTVDACSLMMCFWFSDWCSRCGRMHTCDMGAWLSAHSSSAGSAAPLCPTQKAPGETPVAAAARALPHGRNDANNASADDNDDDV